MRRLVLSLPLLLVLLVPTPAAAQSTLSLADDVSLGDEGSAKLLVTGTVANAPAPPAFRLRTENGCARDADLGTTTSGSTFSIALSAGDLSDAFACAIDAEAGDDSLPTITLTPSASASAANGLALDHTFAVVARGLDPSAGQLVRFIVNASDSNDAFTDARIVLDGRTYGAIVVPSEEGSDVATSAVFDVPARAWADAVVTGKVGNVEVELDGGAHRTMTLRPTVKLDLIDDDDDR